MKELNDTSIEELIEKSGFWSESGPFSDIVLSTRIRLGRNIYNVSFPHMQDEGDADYIRAITQKFINESEFHNLLKFLDLNNISSFNRRLLRERNIITSEMEEKKNSFVIIGINSDFDIMINEEDHFKIQVIKPGLQINDAYEIANDLDDELNRFVTYAYSDDLGYITTSPSNLGTGLKVSTMLHLPILSMNKKIAEVMKLVEKNGLKLVGTRGVGIKTLGMIYQLSNSASLGITEQEIIEKLVNTTLKIIDMESKARDDYLSEYENQLEDKICRSYGIIKYARTIDYVEAMNYLSDIRLGIILSFIKSIDLCKINDLMINSQWSHLQKIANRTFIDYSECDSFRAYYLREQLEWSTVYG